MKFFDVFFSKNEERIIGLDILRSVAIFNVLFEHSGYLIPEKFQIQYQNINLIKIDGVSIFFVLSGFLIGGILLKIIIKTNFTINDLINFWIRRWFRTIPNYFLVLFGLIVYRLIIFNEVGDFDFRYIFFSQNLLSRHPSFFPEAWSLSIEEWFYLLFPFSCYVFYKFIKNKSKSIIISVLLFILFPLIIRIIKYEYGIGIYDFDLEFRKIVILRLDSLMYGVIAAYFFFKHPKLWTKYRFYFFILGLLLLIFLFFNPYDWKNFYRPIYFNIESITALFFLPFLSLYKTTNIKTLDKLFIFFSIISYSMYLINLSVVQWILIPLLKKYCFEGTKILAETFFINYCLFWLLTIIGSCLLYRIYEKPFTNLRDKINIKSTPSG